MTERVDLGAGAAPGVVRHHSIMQRDHTTPRSDFEVHETDDVTQQFWGATRGWASREQPTVDHDAPRRDVREDDHTGSLKAIRDGFAAFRPNVRTQSTGQIERTRQHGVVRPTSAASTPARTEATIGELASGWYDHANAPDSSGATDLTDATGEIDDWFVDDVPMPARRVPRRVTPVADRDLVPLSHAPAAGRVGLGGVDPLLLRVGVLIAAVVLLLPVALSLRSDDRSTIGTQSIAAVAVGGVDVQPSDRAAAATSVEPVAPPQADAVANATDPVDAGSAPVFAGSSAAASAAADTAADPVAAPAPTETESASVGDVAQVENLSDASADLEPATVSASAERLAPECPQTYEAGAGDSWYRIADAAGITPSALLNENGATVDTVILPGDDICLPAGGTVPTQPTVTTAAPDTTAAPATTEAPSPTTTEAPSTTQAPATTTPATTTPATAGQVEQIIRDVWPDELEEKALQIAWRESRYVATASNGWCCHGVFQIYWSVHRNWLDDYGIYSSSDLFDARKNTEAAYALYRRAGGWGPWGG